MSWENYNWRRNILSELPWKFELLTPNTFSTILILKLHGRRNLSQNIDYLNILSYRNTPVDMSIMWSIEFITYSNFFSVAWCYEFSFFTNTIVLIQIILIIYNCICLGTAYIWFCFACLRNEKQHLDITVFISAYTGFF